MKRLQLNKNNKLRAWIEISENALLNNIKNIKKISLSQLGAAIKANAYGHGINEIISILENNNLADYYFVQYEDEISELKNINIKKPILIMSPIFDEEFFKNNNFEYTIYSIESLKTIINLSKKYNKIALIHLKIEIGMHRLGIFSEELMNLIKLIKNNKLIKLIGIMSHSNDNRRYSTELTELQLIIFNKIIIILKSYFPNIISHALSSGFIDIKNNYNMIRCGGYLYGFYKSNNQKQRIIEKYNNINFEQILSLKSRIIQIKNVEKDNSIGYGIDCMSKKNMTIAIISIGYADGYNIKFSNGIGGCIIKNQYAPICGFISMGLTIIDITNLNNIFVDDIVILTDGTNELIKLENLANKIDISPICFTASLNPKLPRIIVK